MTPALEDEIRIAIQTLSRYSWTLPPEDLTAKLVVKLRTRLFEDLERKTDKSFALLMYYDLKVDKDLK